MPPRPDLLAAPDSATATAVALSGVRHEYRSGGRRILALDGIDLRLAAGESLAVVGPSGCGKSTLLRMIAGFLRPSHGEIRVGGEPVTGPGPDRGVVFQQPRLFPWLSVRGNVAYGLREAGWARSRRRERVEQLLELVGLGDVGGLRPYELSGGMQQRAAIARALAPDPAILLLDEPFAALDALTRERLQEELRGIWLRTGKTLVLVTHSVDEAALLGSRVVVLSPRPGTVVLDESSALPRVEQARETPEFGALRTRILQAVRGE
ncbi:ABC transporter ATP-binding protein [Catellatospora bangladeshensis]|uniref:Putative ABC transporter, ATP-binding protein n=1 Tax=Catellatospora bangladeshensis TaxID=310355 RepID=A0A8J3JGI3_9ACTN|nr:ABC transporter ATP-binding protein [Catellatospora bangladeshensis]GIF84156.1 putative ABC transporter, ATP-binding protein [Catellatospora bangladeshensis]